ncbi:Methionine--tRNA ligase [Streptomyces microflavus]
MNLRWLSNALGPYCVGCEEYKLPGDLIDGEGEFAGQKLCPIHKKPVELLKEENYFFKLSEYGPKLLEFYAANPGFIQPESARNEIVNFVEQGLQDLSISRSTFDWGVPVPWDDKHVIYVWIDALLNYATAVGYGANQEKFDGTFPADVHLIGKDILRFHTVIWPAMLMAQGLPLPGKVVANGWLMVGGEMSKSNLTGIKPQDLTSHFAWMFSSRSRDSSSSVGAPIIRSWALPFSGKAIVSRMFGRRPAAYHDAVDTRGDATVRRGAEAERAGMHRATRRRSRGRNRRSRRP